LLRKAHAAGFLKNPATVAHRKKDKDLNALRSRDDFETLLPDLEQKKAGAKQQDNSGA
jgi:hypothetical protein